jgi:fructose-bisphosphate aldolase, class I
VPGLQKVVAALVAPGKGILAADASSATMSRRLEAVGAAPAAAMRRGYRRLLLITQGLAAWISGIILCDETLSQDLPDGTPSGQGAPALGIMADVKVDKGTAPLPFSDGGVVTQGLDGLRGRLADYRELGAVFAKWRAVLNIMRERLRVRMRGAPVQGSRVADNCQRASQASAAGSPDCAQPLSNERQAGRA